MDGLGKFLINSCLNHPDVRSIKKIMLSTKTAERLYDKLGFNPVNEPDYIWQMIRNSN
ncbi:hypothetical protein GKC56_04870 [Neisseriaceae bacterium PsAf]|nr:hypothetical protein [Neisseriaceae bacterium PsAf]MCV2502792.1 hypothetical protein [Neisseriaceae bacterium]